MEEKTGRQPDFKGYLNLAVWVREKDGQPQLYLKIADSAYLNKNEPKPKAVDKLI